MATVSRETTPRLVAVIGTGTGIGKTHATTALALAVSARGQSVAALKPIESGVGTAISDYTRLARVSSVPIAPQPYAFPDAVSPHLAARRARRAVRLDVVRDWVTTHRADWTFVETAGALLSPIDLRRTNLDLVAALPCDAVLLVASDRLGVLHDVRACLLALRAALPRVPVALALQAPRRPDASTGTNAAELRRLGLAQAAGVLPRGRPDQLPVRTVATRMLRALTALAPR